MVHLLELSEPCWITTLEWEYPCVELPAGSHSSTNSSTHLRWGHLCSTKSRIINLWFTWLSSLSLITGNQFLALDSACCLILSWYYRSTLPLVLGMTYKGIYRHNFERSQQENYLVKEGTYAATPCGSMPLEHFQRRSNQELSHHQYYY